MSVSVFDHPVLAGLLGDDAIAAHFTADAEIEAMLEFEMALARAEETVGLVPSGTAVALEKACESFSPDHDALRSATARDGVIVPEFVRQLRRAVGDEFGPHVHFGATSQDMIDTALVMRLKPVLADMADRLAALLAGLDGLNARFGDNPLMAHTRMQRALPIRCGDRIASWARPLRTLADDGPTIRDRVVRLQFGGAVGTLDRLGDKGSAVASAVSSTLGLDNSDCWHTDRTSLAELAGWLARLTGSLGKMGQDVALMAQNDVAAIRLAGGGGSSAMPHKQNPVAAEVLVTLARFNATLVSGMHQALVHENERSGAAWTLEWMLLPQMTVAAGAALSTARGLVADIDDMGKEDQ